MAIYHCSIKIGSRAKGQSAIAAAAYRAGDKLEDVETGITSDFSRKSGIVHSEISLCENAPAEYADRATLWNAVQHIEKAKDARLWREFEVALPREFGKEKQIDTIRDFVKKLNEQGMCVDWSIHDKGDGNPHAHIMATTRSITPDGKWAPKSRKVYDLDENGERIFQKVDKSGRKQYKNHKEDYNDWNKKERVEEWRKAWADCCNERLSERDRIDHRSFKRRSIDRVPSIHEGYIARKIAAEGGSSERVTLNDNIRKRNILQEKIRKIKELKELVESVKAAIKMFYKWNRIYYDDSNFEDLSEIPLINNPPTTHFDGHYCYANMEDCLIVCEEYDDYGNESKGIIQFESLEDMWDGLIEVRNYTQDDLIDKCLSGREDETPDFTRHGRY